jgi:UPF0755 protein
MGLTLDEVVIMASIVERETRRADERAMVSQVIHRRLAINMRLEMCSTVLYTNPGVTHVLNVHRAVDTPWNTYMHFGLPVGPISSPGESSIYAVLWPQEHEYLYFVLADEETGRHHFSRTYQEHVAARERYGV